MPPLFEEVKINRMVLKNRSVRSATWTGLAEADGRCGPRLIDFYERLAHGEIGLIVTGLAYTLPNGKAVPRQLGICDDEMIAGLLKLTERIHRADGKIAMQIAHCGAQTLHRDQRERPIWGPSAVPEKIFGNIPQAMSQDEIRQTVRSFADATGRVKKAGFDAVQIQAAHGWLISQFLSPAKNRRTDSYGGAVQNRARLLFEICAAVRETLGDEFPVLVKLNCRDFVANGFDEEDAQFVALQLEALGVDAIEISGGTPAARQFSAARLNIRRVGDEAYFLPHIKTIRESLSIPLILVGGIRSLGMVCSILETGDADLIALARPLIREPDLIRRWQQGSQLRAECISCNNCYAAATTPGGIHCRADRSGKEKTEQRPNAAAVTIENEKNFIAAIREGIKSSAQ